MESGVTREPAAPRGCPERRALCAGACAMARIIACGAPRQSGGYHIVNGKRAGVNFSMVRYLSPPSFCTGLPQLFGIYFSGIGQFAARRRIKRASYPE